MPDLADLSDLAKLYNCGKTRLNCLVSLEWCDIGYNFLIGGDGNVYMGRGWDRVGAHTPNYNALSVAFSLMGNFENFLPSSTMLSATEDLIACAVDRVSILHIIH